MKEQEFWASMERKPDGCWIWQRAISSSGYGMVSYCGVTNSAHRLAWVLARGPIPVGHGYHGTVVAHKCDVRACCNPDHLFLTDNRGNQIDALSKGRGTAARLTERQVLEIVSWMKSGVSARELSVRYGVTVAAIRSIAKRRTWSHVTENAGDLRFAPREIDTTKLRKANYARIRALLDSGKTLRQIARECGTTHTTVARVARQTCNSIATPFQRMNAVIRERIHDLAHSGSSQREIAETLSVSQASVSRTLIARRVAGG
jgi:hypothetical protein